MEETSRSRPSSTEPARSAPEDLVASIREAGLPVRLHLGCGPNHLEGFLNVDVIDYPSVDLLADITCLPLPAESVDDIYMNAVLEHIAWRELSAVLGGWHRLLKRGGTLRIDSIPDFRRTAEAYLRGEPGNVGSTTFDLFNVIRYTHGPYIVEDGQPNISQLHKSLFDPDQLRTLLRDSGFEVVTLENVRWGNEPIDNNINLVATKL